MSNNADIIAYLEHQKYIKQQRNRKIFLVTCMACALIAIGYFLYSAEMRAEAINQIMMEASAHGDYLTHDQAARMYERLRRSGY